MYISNFSVSLELSEKGDITTLKHYLFEKVYCISDAETELNKHSIDEVSGRLRFEISNSCQF